MTATRLSAHFALVLFLACSNVVLAQPTFTDRGSDFDHRLPWKWADQGSIVPHTPRDGSSNLDNHFSLQRSRTVTVAAVSDTGPKKRQVAEQTRQLPAEEQPTPSHTTKPLVVAHYMPWYGSKSVSGSWGWHWTMNKFDPDRIRWEGQREVASHDYPLLGAYDSSDPELLECHALLMKLAGLDGAIVDWYGTRNFNDYAINHRHTQALIPWLKKAGLKFALCYEDQSVGHMLKAKVLEEKDAVSQGTEDLLAAEREWLNDDAYLQLSNRPVVLVFGPQQFQNDEWNTLRRKLKTNPLFFGLPHLAKDRGMDGLFCWPPVTGGKTLATADWQGELALNYQRAKVETVIATAFPGFNDVYQQAGLHESYGHIADRDGATFRESLEQALQSGAPLIQLATWNDFGEGTMIEPTRDKGYRYLITLQERLKSPFAASELRLPIALYQLRKRGGDQKVLDAASLNLFAGRCAAAATELDRISTQLQTQPAQFSDSSDKPDPDYRLATDILYRDATVSSESMKLHCRLDVYHPANVKDFATVVWFHGGGITKGSRSIPLPLRRQGFAVVAVSYRLAPAARTPDFLDDAAAATAWVQKNIHRFGGNPRHIILTGHSAGGYLATMTALESTRLAAHGGEANNLAGLVPLSGQMITHFTIRAERNIPQGQPVVDEFAPLFHVRKDTPPMLVITGDREKELAGRYEENAYFWRMMKLAGHPNITLTELKGYDHGGMAEPAFPALIEFIGDHTK